MSRVPPTTRPRANGSGGSSNGYYNDGPTRQFDQTDNDPSPRGKGDGGRQNQERRPGGYGGFTSADREDPPAQGPHVTRPTSLERTQAHRRSGDKSWGGDQSRSRSRPGAGRYADASQQIEG
jgi:exocyst complex component 4